MPQSLHRLSQLFADLSKINAFSWLVSGGIFGIVFLLGLGARKLLFDRLTAWARSTHSSVDAVLVGSLYRPWLLWMAMLGIYAAEEMSDLPDPLVRGARSLLIFLLIVSVTWVLARAAGRLVQLYDTSPDGTTGGTLPQILATLIVTLLGLLTLLNAFGFSVTPALATLGVGGLAVALALQDTLSNFFAGFYVSIGGQVRVGDFIQLDAGPKGFVTDIGWRTTTLRELTNNLVVIPNNKLAQSIVTNYHLPETRTVLSIPVNVTYDNDPAKVEAVLLDVVRQAAVEMKAILLEPAPRARLIGFSDASLQFNLSVQIAHYEAQFDIQDDLRRRILRSLHEKGILMPTPVRAVELRQSAVSQSAEPGAGKEANP